MLDPNPDAVKRNLLLTYNGLLFWGAGGFLCILIYGVSSFATSSSSREGFFKLLTITGNGFLLAAASISCGALLGFLFGIPRTAQNNSPKPTTTPAAGAPLYEVNTNLEQISDWLTKILVGVGLTQLVNLATKVQAFGSWLETYFDGNALIPVAIGGNFSICGFFSGYLLTRLFLTGAFAAAEQSTLAILHREEKAKVFAEAGNYDKAVAELEAAIAQFTPDTPKTQKQRVYEQLIYNYLYQDAPQGFEQVIRHGRAYLEQEPQNPTPRIWVALAAAYGQQFAWEQAHQKRETELRAARANSLAAIQQAIRLEPQTKQLLRMLWDPKDPTKVSSEENDLECFYDDPDFRQLLT